MRIQGYFNGNDEPALKLDLISKSIEVLIDTGFAGSLVVPQNLSMISCFSLKALKSSIP